MPGTRKPLARATRSTDQWAAYRAAQQARRHVRVSARVGLLRDLLPPGVVVTAIVNTPDVQLAGYGLDVRYSPLHNHVTGLRPELVILTPKQLVGEFRWRWKRDGCPA